MSEEKVDFLLCYTVRSGYQPWRPSRKELCAQCGTPVWVAFSSPPAVTILCMDCGAKTMEKDPEAEIMPPTPAQIADIRNALGQGEN